ncbi:unnamed protein product, partial [Ectocarpus sp. 8 AP-2014]
DRGRDYPAPERPYSSRRYGGGGGWRALVAAIFCCVFLVPAVQVSTPSGTKKQHKIGPMHIMHSLHLGCWSGFGEGRDDTAWCSVSFEEGNEVGNAFHLPYT